jgi:hypothetical protein
MARAHDAARHSANGLHLSAGAARCARSAAKTHDARATAHREHPERAEPRAKEPGTRISSNEVKHLTEASITALYDNEDLALALTTTIKVIEVLTEQTAILERAVLKKARLRAEFEPLLSVWGIGKILALTIMYEAGDTCEVSFAFRANPRPPA